MEKKSFTPQNAVHPSHFNFFVRSPWMVFEENSKWYMKMAALKPSIRRTVAVVFLLAVAITISSRRLLFLDGPVNPAASALPPISPADLAPTLLRMAAEETGDDVTMRKDVDRIINPWKLAGAGEEDSRFRSSRTRNSAPSRGGRPVSPEVRRAVENWYGNKRYDPSVMEDLAGTVKPAIDRALGFPAASVSSRYNSCAVVGNSGILLGAGHGELIDSHDLVIRLNNAQIDNHLHDVGSKTGLSFINSNILHLCSLRRNCFCHPYGAGVPIIMYICQARHFAEHLTCAAEHEAPLLVTDARLDVLCARLVKYYSVREFMESTGKRPEDWKGAHDMEMFHYSSGMEAVMLAAGICERVSAFGFGKSPDAKHHYHTNQKTELGLHDYEAEYELYRDLAERPREVPFLNESSFRFPPIVFYL